MKFRIYRQVSRLLRQSFIAGKGHGVLRVAIRKHFTRVSRYPLGPARVGQKIAATGRTFAGVRHLFAGSAKRSPEAGKLSPGCVTFSPSARKDRRTWENF